MTKLTCIVQSRGDGCCGSLCAVLRHAAVGLHGERVVQMRIQVRNDDLGLLQARGAWLETDLLAAGDAQGALTVLAQNTVGEVTAPSGHQRWAPGQQQPAVCRQGGGGQLTRGTGWGLGKEVDDRTVSLVLQTAFDECEG